jgi:DNA polymerase-1
MIDYDQMEFRMMLDYAGQLDLIEEIVKGLDPHQATADLVGIPRRPAKTLNFALLYGMGNEKLANTLDIELYEAKRFKFKYFSNLPMVKMFLNKTSLKAEKIGFVRDWLGRVFYFGDPKFSYKAANAIIQGGCSSVMKIALCRLHDFLKDKKSNLIMTVHDEALFEVHESEFYIIEKLQEIMENVYPHKHIKLTCSVSHSLESWGDPVEGYPEDAKGNEIQDQSSRSFKEAIGERASAVVH